MEAPFIRAMRPDDLEDVLRLERASQPVPWSEGQFSQELAAPFASVDLLFREGVLAGYLCSWLLCGELHIQNVVTAPEFRRRGVAASLLHHVLERAGGQGFEAAFLEVRAGNGAAIALYQRFGFGIVSTRRGYYADGEDALLMERRAEKGAVPHLSNQERE